MITPAGNTAGVLIAGGKSTRMGREKATIEIDGGPLWQRQLALLDGICEPVAVAAPERPAWLDGSRTFVADDPLARGPLAGLIAALAWGADAGAAHVLALAVDLPAMKAEFLQSLAGASTPAWGVICEAEEGFEPLCGVYPVGALPLLRSMAAAGTWKLQQAIENLVNDGQLTRRVITAAERPLFFNLNTPDDLAVLSRGNS